MAGPNVEMVRCLRLVWSTLGRTERERGGGTYEQFVADLHAALAAQLPAGVREEERWTRTPVTSGSSRS